MSKPLLGTGLLIERLISIAQMFLGPNSSTRSISAPAANRPEYPGSERPFARSLQGPQLVERRSTSVPGCEPTFARNGEAFPLAPWARERARPAPGRFE